MREFYRTHKIVRVATRIVAAVLVIMIGGVIFLTLWPAFGGRASKEDRVDYAKRASAYHPWDDPAARFVKAGEEKDILVVSPMIGETVNLEQVDNHTDRWWETVE